MFQSLTIVGNVGRDAELRYLDNGTAVADVSIAVNQYMGRDRDDVTLWFRATLWGKFAESMAQYLNKGTRVLMVGELQANPETGGPRVFERNDGTHGASFEVRVRELKLMGSGGGAPRDNSGGGAGQDTDDIPF